MPLEKDKSEEFIISKSLERIVNLKKRIDRLIFLYISVTIFGIANFDCFEGFSILGGVNIRDNWMYHLGIVISLTIIFGLIGSHLIEYVVKRYELDRRFLGSYRWQIVTDEKEKSRKKILEKQLRKDQFNIISKTMIPSSIYEYLYVLNIYNKIRKDWTRNISIVLLFICFFIGHGLSVSHLLLIDMFFALKILGIILILVALFMLYRVFVKSVGRIDEKLKGKIRDIILYTGLCAIIVYVLMLTYGVFDSCC